MKYNMKNAKQNTGQDTQQNIVDSGGARGTNPNMGQGAKLEQEITDFLKTLPGNDNICGAVQSDELPAAQLTAANDNDILITKRETGVNLPIGGADVEDMSVAVEQGDNPVELDFSDNRGGCRGFLAEDL